MGWTNFARTFGPSTRLNCFDRCLGHVACPESRANKSSQTVALAYRQVLIPSAVYEELAPSKPGLAPAVDLSAEPWLVVATPKDQKRVRELRGNLDPGEAEAIVLAIERGADLLLVDERRARRTATVAGLTVIGLLGVVGRAKRSGLIDQAKPVLGYASPCAPSRLRTTLVLSCGTAPSTPFDFGLAIAPESREWR